MGSSASLPRADCSFGSTLARTDSLGHFLAEINQSLHEGWWVGGRDRGRREGEGREGGMGRGRRKERDEGFEGGIEEEGIEGGRGGNRATHACTILIRWGAPPPTWFSTGNTQSALSVSSRSANTLEWEIGMNHIPQHAGYMCTSVHLYYQISVM